MQEILSYWLKLFKCIRITCLVNITTPIEFEISRALLHLNLAYGLSSAVFIGFIMKIYASTQL